MNLQTQEPPASEPNSPAEPVTDLSAPENADTSAPGTGEKPAPDTTTDAASETPVIVDPGTAVPAEAADTASDTASAAADSAGTALTEAAEKMTGVPAELVFGLGVGLMAMFIWYFGTESATRRRMIGSFLAVAVTASALWFFDNLPLNKGIEIQGGIAMTIRIKPGEGRDVTPESQQQAIKVLQGRLNAYGTEDVTLVPQGSDRIFLQIPGVGEEQLEKIKNSLKQIAKLDFSILHPQSAQIAGEVASGVQTAFGYKAIPKSLSPEQKERGLPEGSAGYVLVEIPYSMSGTHLTSASYAFTSDGHVIDVSLNGEGAKIMSELTIEHVKEEMAIILTDVSDDAEKSVVLSHPVIQGAFSAKFQISGGNFNEQSAKELASALENPLENPIEIEHSNYISPTMGEETVRQGVLAGISGLAATLLFILLYYRFAGIVAMIGLGINIAIIFGSLALFKFTLTLPGIAGIILTIGVAIDANVLIYERLREEMASGKPLPSAIKTAYEKALSAIIDANITTLITAIILFFVATGTVKGFAVTLTIGILATLFSSLLVTRICFTWATDTKLIKKLSFMNLIPGRTIDFLSKRRIFLTGSLILVIASLVIVPMNDPRGVDLKGGDLLTFQSTGDLTKEKIEESLADAGLGLEPIIQVQTPVGATGEFFTIRTAFNTGDKVQAEIEKDFGIELTDITTDQVGSAVGAEMLKTSAWALGLGMLAIMLYVTIRFEFAFALGALTALVHDLIITIGITTLLGREVSLITVGAFLTIAGYSINDTIVVFDRVREGLRIKRGEVKDVMNYCLNATLGRTLLTSVTTLITVGVLYLFGGPALQNFSLTLIIGIIIGTYSSIFVASPIVLWWARKAGINLRREVLDAEQGKVDPQLAQS